jgi:ubiquitin-protein ligase
MDRNGRVIVLKILFNEGYPEKPPLVTSSPPIRDVCFDNKGVLSFATKKGLFVWKKYKRYSNPLVYLADELANKYKAI